MPNVVRRPAFPPDSTIADSSGEFLSFCLRAGLEPEGTMESFMEAVSSWDPASENATKPISLTAKVPGVGTVSYSYRVILSGDEPRARTYFSFVPESWPAETFPTADGLANRVYSAVSENGPSR